MAEFQPIDYVPPDIKFISEVPIQGTPAPGGNSAAALLLAMNGGQSTTDRNATSVPQSSQQSGFAAVRDAFYGQESNYGRNSRTSSTGAIGPMQIEPGTWRQYAMPGEQIGNAQDNRAVGSRILADYYHRYGGDPARVAVAYFSGPGNVAPAGSATPWIRDTHDPSGKTVSSYVSDIMGRINGASTPPASTATTRLRDVATQSSD